MIIHALWDLQQVINNKLISNNDLMSLLNGVFYKVPQDTKFPYITLNFDNIINNSIRNFSSIKFELIINIFYRDWSSKNIIKTVAFIDELIKEIKFKNANYQLVNLNFSKGYFDHSNDGLTQVFSIKFNGSLRDKNDE